LGDGGLYQKSVLRKNVDEGLLCGVDIELNLGGEVKTVNPFFVGDKAFPLGRHLLKNYEGTRAPGSAAGKFNRSLTNCRRHSELAFGWLKGRWCFLKRNCFWNDLVAVKEATGTCAGLHNFLVERSVAYDTSLDDFHVDDAPVAPLQGQRGAPNSREVGMAVRELIARHLSGN
jgi:hypothetical protein